MGEIMNEGEIIKYKGDIMEKWMNVVEMVPEKDGKIRLGSAHQIYIRSKEAARNNGMNGVTMEEKKEEEDRKY